MALSSWTYVLPKKEDSSYSETNTKDPVKSKTTAMFTLQIEYITRKL